MRLILITLMLVTVSAQAQLAKLRDTVFVAGVFKNVYYDSAWGKPGTLKITVNQASAVNQIKGGLAIKPEFRTPFTIVVSKKQKKGFDTVLQQTIMPKPYFEAVRPACTIGNSRNNPIAKANLLAAGKIEVLDGIQEHTNTVKIVSYKVFVRARDKKDEAPEICNGPYFSATVIEKLKALKKGDKVYFIDIMANLEKETAQIDSFYKIIE